MSAQQSAFNKLLAERGSPGWMPPSRVQEFIHSVIQGEERSARARWTEDDLRKWWTQLLKHCPGLDKTEARKFRWVKTIVRGSWGPSLSEVWPAYEEVSLSEDEPKYRKKPLPKRKRLQKSDAQMLLAAIQLEPLEERARWTQADFEAWLDGVLRAVKLKAGYWKQLEFSLEVLEGLWGPDMATSE